MPRADMWVAGLTLYATYDQETVPYGHGVCHTDPWQTQPHTLATKPAHVLRCATASATTHRISNMRLAPLRAVCPVGSSGGDTSQTSPPMSCNPRNPRSITCASRMLNPPADLPPQSKALEVS